MKCVPSKELIVLHEFQFRGRVFLVFVCGVAAHSGDAAVFLFGTFDGDDHPSTFCLLSHGFLFRAILCAGCVESRRHLCG